MEFSPWTEIFAHSYKMADEFAESISTVFSMALAEEKYRLIVNYEIKHGAKEYNV